MADDNDQLNNENLPEDSYVSFDAEQSIGSPGDSGLIPIGEQNREKLRVIYENLRNLHGDAKFLTRVAEAGTYENILFFALHMQSSEAERLEMALSLIGSDQKEKFKTIFKENINGTDIALGSSLVHSPTPLKGASGVQAALGMMAMRKGRIRRILLISSGFSIDVRVPSPDDLNQLLLRSNADATEYGRMFGAHIYLYFDLILKQNFIDMLISLICMSSLKEWDKPGVLVNSIKLADYHHIMTELAYLMYPDGYDKFIHYCTRPHDKLYPDGCSHTETLKIDLRYLVQTQYGRISTENLFYLNKARSPSTKVSRDDIDKYQQGFDFPSTFTINELKFTLKNPSLSDYIEAGQLFNSELLNEIQANNTKGIYDAIAYRDLRVFIPYIARIDHLSDDGDVVMSVDDALAISTFLDFLRGEDSIKNELRDKISSYINSIQLTHICYPSFACSACGYMPETPAGFFVVDPQTSFFTIAYHKLTQSS